MLKHMDLENLTVFPHAEMQFSPGLNVFVGENGSGKSHLLKLAYAVLAAHSQTGRLHPAPTKSLLQRRVAEKLIAVFRPESLGRLARRGQGVRRCAVDFHFENPAMDCAFDFSTKSETEVSISGLAQKWQEKTPVYLPTRELLTLYPGFVSLYDQHYLEFPETYRDTCLLLGAPALKGAREKKVASVLAPLEEAMGGKVVLDKSGRFYLNSPGIGSVEMFLVAEGLRKLAMLARLIATGSLLDKGYLFWDEPETNLNPKLVKKTAEVILALCNSGIQVFLASHSLFLLREIELLCQKKYENVQQRWFGLKLDKGEVAVEQGDTIECLQTLVVLDEELSQSDRYLAFL